MNCFFILNLDFNIKLKILVFNEDNNVLFVGGGEMIRRFEFGEIKVLVIVILLF